MNKNEYKKRIEAIKTKHIVFPSGLEVDAQVPAAAEMIDALIEAGFDIQDLLLQAKKWKEEEEQAQKQGRPYFNNDVYKMSAVLADTIRDTDGEKISNYVKYIPDDYRKLEEVAIGFFMVSPSLESMQQPQNTSGSATKEQDSGLTNSSDSQSPSGTSTSP